MSKEKINHPSHYGGDTVYEVIKVIEAWGLDKNFCLGNAVKYIARAEKKGAKLVDLKKAQFYLNRYIEQQEKKDGKYAKRIRLSNNGSRTKRRSHPAIISRRSNANKRHGR